MDILSYGFVPQTSHGHTAAVAKARALVVFVFIRSWESWRREIKFISNHRLLITPPSIVYSRADVVGILKASRSRISLGSAR